MTHILPVPCKHRIALFHVFKREVLRTGLQYYEGIIIIGSKRVVAGSLIDLPTVVTPVFGLVCVRVALCESRNAEGNKDADPKQHHWPKDVGSPFTHRSVLRAHP